MKWFKVYYRYWHRGRIIDGELKVRAIDGIDKTKAKELIIKKHYYPKNSRAAENNILGIKIFEILK